MRTRLLIGSLWLVVVVLFVALVVAQEDRFEPRPPIDEALLQVRLPTVDMTFDPDSRELNLQLLGLSGRRMERAMEEATRLAERREKLRRLLLETEARDVAGAFCRHDLPMPYRAASVLLVGGEGRPRLQDVTSQARLDQWEDYPASDVLSLFEAWEKHEDRVHEDTLIAVAALVLGRTLEAVGDRQDPWQRVATEGGDFRRVEERFPGVGDVVARYLATAVVLAEIVEETPQDFRCGLAAEAL